MPVGGSPSSTTVLYSVTEECLKDIPELFESQPEDSLRARNAAISGFRDLGPMDMVQVTKLKPKGKSETKQLGSYHWVSGLDASSSASIAVYVTNLTYSLGSTGGWLNQKLSSPWKIGHCTVCVWNAFSKVDVRVEVSIPGGVRSYAIAPSSAGHHHGTGQHPSGKLIATTPKLWTETYLSSVLRALAYSGREIRGLRRVNPLPTVAHETRFLEAARSLFDEGWKLGVRNGTPQQANLLNNYLTQDILTYFVQSQRPKVAYDFFSPLASQNELVNDILAQCLLGMDAETEAVALIHRSLTKSPTLSPLLRTQFDFLIGKAAHGLAAQIIQHTIRTAPIDLESWSRLAGFYVEIGDYEKALKTMNSFPFVLPAEADPTRMPVAVSFSQPRKDLTLIDLSSIDSDADSILETLRSAQLKGTPKLAYDLLVRVCNRVGWEELLHIRAAVFVMEEDYHLHSQESQLHYRGSHEDPVVEDRRKILEGKTKENTIDTCSSDENRSSTPNPNDKPAVSLMEPSKATAPTSDANIVGGHHHHLCHHPQSPLAADRKKRLCERWLDALFMVLFEDMRVYMIYKAELQQHKDQNKIYQRTPREWLILGDLCRRLCKLEDAQDAYQRCIDLGYSKGAWQALMEIWVKEGRLSHALTAASHLILAGLNQYEQVDTHPTPLTVCLLQLARRHGLARVKSTTSFLNLDKQVLRVMETMFTAWTDLGALGSDW